MEITNTNLIELLGGPNKIKSVDSVHIEYLAFTGI